ncbi:MAG: bifunctional phosphopantothenoylcysteine decarboxylase/phosphopantothenate--cysteine ligase CoaBC, partial [Bacilli bacterium]
TFQTLSRHHVIVDTFQEDNPSVVAHIDLADRADLVIVAPATANFIAKAANGIADDMLTTTLLATRAPVFVCPAMNVNMYAHPTVIKNMKMLCDYGYHFIEPGEGQLACGYVGKGRLSEPLEIIGVIETFLAQRQDWTGKHLLVTAGATREHLDPARCFTNLSTGKMGYAIAEMFKEAGGEVTLVTGPTLLPKVPGVKTIEVQSAQDMYDEVMKNLDKADVVIKAAAVTDYRPVESSKHKLKKGDGLLTVTFERTKDILAEIGNRNTGKFVVGFAAESENVDEYALEKIKRKKCDLLVANNINEPGAGFAEDTNIVSIFDQQGVVKRLPKMSKKEVAKELLKIVKDRIK